MRTLLVAAIALCGLLGARGARACGAAYPGGPMVCTMADSPEAHHTHARRREARVAVSYALTSTRLSFGGDRADMLRHTLFATSEIPLSARGAVQLGGGGVVGGELERRGRVYDLGPGVALFAGAGIRAIAERGPWPFLQLTGAFSVTRAATRSPSESLDFTAFDVRLGAIAGKTIGEIATPYVVARAFGGPILWHAFGDDRLGTDLYKHQVGAGIAIALAAIDVFAEGIAVGERGLAAGIGATF